MIEDIRSPGELLVIEHPHGGEMGEMGLSAIHRWLNCHHPRAGICEYCEREAKTEWALVAERYSRDIHDYAELCHPCHMRFDRGGD